MLSRAELVALTVAILAAAAGAIGGEVVGFILLGTAVLLGIAIVSGLGERFGLVARPNVRFLDAEVSGIRELPSAWNGSGVFVSIPVVNERKAAEAAGVEPPTLHECRHGYAALMIAAGVNLKALSTFMGHANIGITLDQYGHLLPGAEDEAAGLLDAFLARQVGGTSPAPTAPQAAPHPTGARS